MDIYVYGFIILLCQIIFAVSGYFVWPSRWNIPAHLSTCFAFTAYFLPLFHPQAFGVFHSETFQKFALLQVIATPCYVVGLLLGSAIRVRSLNNLEARLTAVSEEKLLAITYPKVGWTLFLCSAALIFCFWYMGFIPMFSADPVAAKFFRGDYKNVYTPIAPLFRFAFFVLSFAMPTAIIVSLKSRKLRLLLLVALGTVLMLATLQKAPAVQGILIAGGLLAARNRSTFYLYFVTVLLLVPIGALTYFILDQVTGLDQFAKFYDSESLLASIIAGAPDISDQLLFIEKFEVNRDWTYGKTFVGGMVPYHFKWNPSVWTLSVLNSGDTDVDNVASGGLRLPVSMYGYTAFSYLGAFLVPFLSGIMWGVINRFCARNVDERSLVRCVICLLFFFSIGTLLGDFYRMQYSTVFGVILALWLLRMPRNATVALAENTSSAGKPASKSTTSRDWSRRGAPNPADDRTKNPRTLRRPASRTEPKEDSEN